LDAARHSLRTRLPLPHPQGNSLRKANLIIWVPLFLFNQPTLSRIKAKSSLLWYTLSPSLHRKKNDAADDIRQYIPTKNLSQMTLPVPCYWNMSLSLAVILVECWRKSRDFYRINHFIYTISIIYFIQPNSKEIIWNIIRWNKFFIIDLKGNHLKL
jgi:hypothetical protein